MSTLSYTLEELPSIAKKIIADSSSKTLLFYAEMGVGKTTLIKEIIKQLGSTDTVTSPTFSLVNEYSTPDGLVYHFDFYRLNDEMEALDFGIEEYFEKDTWLFLEWPNKIPNLLPEVYQKISITREGNKNEIIISG